MFGGEPVISLRMLDGRHNVAGAVAPLLERPPEAAWLIVEAGELNPSSPLRKAFEASPAAAAIPAFDAEPAEVGALIKSMAQDAGVVIDPDAFELLLSQLGADRLAIRNEMEKLFLYVGDGGRLTAEDVADLVGEVAAARADRIVDSALLGDATTVETELLRLASEGGSAASVASQGLRHLLALQSMRQTVEGGRTAREAIERARPPVFFRRKPAVEAALRVWSIDGLRDARTGLAAAVLQSRLQPALEFSVVSAALQRIAARAGAGTAPPQFLRRLRDALQLFEIAIGNAQFAAAIGPVPDVDQKAERRGKILLESPYVGVLLRAARRRARLGFRLLGEPLGLPHRQVLLDHEPRQTIRILRRQKGASMTGGKLAGFQHGEDRVGQAQEPQRVRDMDAALADRRRRGPPAYSRIPRSAPGSPSLPRSG